MPLRSHGMSIVFILLNANWIPIRWQSDPLGLALPCRAAARFGSASRLDSNANWHDADFPKSEISSPIPANGESGRGNLPGRRRTAPAVPAQVLR